MNEYQELRDWLTQNAEILKGRNADEIEAVALAAGQSRIAVVQWKTRFRFNHTLEGLI